MPSMLRVAALICLALLPERLCAQMVSDGSASMAAARDDDSRPAWALPLGEPSGGAVRVPQPVLAPITLTAGVEEPTSPHSQKNNDLRSAGQLSAAANGGSNGDKRAAHLSPSSRQSGMPLASSNANNPPDPLKRPNGLTPMAAVAGSLGVVLGVFLLLAWLMRRASPQGLSRLPNEAFEVLGRAPLGCRQNVNLLRCGNKLVLVSITPAGTETITEITDPQEVDRLAGLCRQAGPHSSTAAFRRVFEQLAPKRPTQSAFLQYDRADYDAQGIELSGATAWERNDG
jgi:flagellar biogenesis protein FliO